MVKIDYPTVSLILSIISIVAAIVLFVLQKIIEDEQGIKILFIGSIVGVVGFISIFFTPAFGVYAQVIGTFSTLTSVLCILEGVLRFRTIGNPRKRKWFAVFFFIGFFVIAYVTKSNGPLRYLMHDGLFALMCFMTGYYFLKGTEKTERILSYIFAGAFFAEGLWFLVRWTMALFGAFSNDAFPKHPFIGTIFLVSTIWLLMYVFSILLVISYRAQARMRNTSEKDELTGLYNRRKLDLNLKSFIDRNKTYEERFAVYMMDINGFKMVNDTIGHAFGDMLLIELANKLQTITRSGDFACRLGGDEFIIVLRLAGGEAEAIKAKDRLKSKIEEPFECEKYTVFLKTAIGFVFVEDTTITLDEILNNADRNMYIDKESNYELTKVLR